MDPADDYGGAAFFCFAHHAIAWAAVACVNPDTDDVAGLDFFGIEWGHGFVDDHRVADEISWRRAGNHKQPARRDHAVANGRIRGIDEDDSAHLDLLKNLNSETVGIRWAAIVAPQAAGVNQFRLFRQFWMAFRFAAVLALRPRGAFTANCSQKDRVMSQPLLASLFDETERVPLSVSELTGAIRGTLEKSFGSVWVEGEISNFRPHSSGHWYFTLKDEFAQLRAACYRSSNQRIRFRPEDGLQVRARGRLTVYETKGEYQLIVESLAPVGAGALQLAFEQTKARLQSEGLFAAELKRAIPFFPRRVGVVTSASGAAIRDIINVISRRTRTVHVVVAPARVQGEGAAHEVVRAIRFLNDYHARALRDGNYDGAIDVIIVGRGGGSVEDLWAFNEEVVARAIRASAIPVISAVGHETDFTIADFAADLRAATPSAAAELVAAQEAQLCSALSRLVTNLDRTVRYRIASERAHVRELTFARGFDEVKKQLRGMVAAVDGHDSDLRNAMSLRFRSIGQRLDAAARALSPSELRSRALAQRASIDTLCNSRNAAVTARIEAARQQFGVAAAALDAMSPLKVLERGYAIAQDTHGAIIRDAGEVSEGDALRLRLWKGALDCRVEKTDKN